ncbi:Hypothetical predicted protein [Lecanosticta acicola]|uniref:Uncharacterized protein n=1 Tax=Lecanosticta acicola TaxID=111012 RepID=A0AAI9E8U3_9PEZI|nr:Hypothetical predicted protein [Lecanosticta acicola]
MVGTRSGRTSYDSTWEVPKNPKEANAKVVNKKAPPANTPKGPRGKEKQMSAARAKSTQSKGKPVTEWLGGVNDEEKVTRPRIPIPPEVREPRRAIPTSAEPFPVKRISNDLWKSTTASLSFVYRSELETDPDTETIALNIIDHIIKPENWNPNLSWNVLSATCFFLASKVTGKHRNTAERIAAACKVDPQIAAAMAGSQAFYDPGVQYRLAQALAVSAEDIKRGYRILYGHREKCEELVGMYADRLAGLPHPDQLWAFGRANNAVQVQAQGPAGYAKPMDAPPKAQPQPLSGPAPTTVKDSDEISWDDDILDGGHEFDKAGVTDAITASDAGQMGLPAVEKDPLALLKAAEEKASEADLDLFDLDEFDTYVAENE